MQGANSLPPFTRIHILKLTHLQNLGQTVFVSGATKGIGCATAIAYAKAGAAAIGLGARSDLSSVEGEVAQAAKQAGKKAPKILSVKIDVQHRASVEAAAKEVQKAFGNVDVLVNNAGYLSSFQPVAESDPDEWWKTYEIVSLPHLWILLAPYRVLKCVFALLECEGRLPNDPLFHAFAAGRLWEDNCEPFLNRRAFPNPRWQLISIIEIGGPAILRIHQCGIRRARNTRLRSASWSNPYGIG